MRIFFSCEEAIFVFFFSSLKLGINLLPRTFAPSCRWDTCDKLSVTTNKNKQTKIIINMLFFILFGWVSTQLLTNRWRHEILPLWTGDCLARIDAAMMIGLCLAIVLRTKEVAKLMCKKFWHNRSVTPDIIWNEKYRWFASLRIHLGRRAQIQLFYIIVQIICFNLLHQGEVWGLKQVHWTKK